MPAVLVPMILPIVVAATAAILDEEEDVIVMGVASASPSVSERV